jgi:hypothetical protein
MNQSQNKSVFISHSSKDFAIASEICANLESMGVTCWIAPRDIQPGENYGAAILKGLETSSAVIFLMTESSNKSGPVQSEIERAFNYNKVIIPIRLKDIKLSKELEFFVAKAQWIDAIVEPLKKRLDLVRDVVHAIETNHSLPTIPAEKQTFLGAVERFIENRFRHKFTSALGAFLVLVTLGGTTLYMQQQSTTVVTKASESISSSSVEITQAATGIKQFGSQIDGVKKEVSGDPRKELFNMGLSWSTDAYLGTLNDTNIRSLFEQGGMTSSRTDLLTNIYVQSYTPETFKHLNAIKGKFFGECPPENLGYTYFRSISSKNGIIGLDFVKSICPDIFKDVSAEMIDEINYEIRNLQSAIKDAKKDDIDKYSRRIKSFERQAASLTALGYPEPAKVISAAIK